MNTDEIILLIRTIIMLILSVPAYYLALRYNTHMLQLNGYKTNEQLSWLSANIRKQWILIFAMLVSLLMIFVPVIASDIVCYITLALIILVYRAHKRLNTKKNIVYTARVKRLLVTVCILTAIILIVPYIIGGFKVMGGVFLLSVGILLFLVIIANIINKPLEKAIATYYINDAKKMLSSVPGIKIIGITGSYGKTSVKFYLQTLLSARYSVLVTPASFNTPMGVVRTIRESLRHSHEIFICEMGARYVGDIKEICDIVHPGMGVITSIGPQHLETFGDISHIKDTKFELADALPDGGKLFLNGDNEYIQDKSKGYDNKVYYHAVTDSSSDTGGISYKADILSVSSSGTKFSIEAPDGESQTYTMKLIGEHNVINVAGAIAIAHELDIPLKELIVPVRRIQPVEHRMQLRPHGEFTIIDDAYNSNPVGSKAALATLAMFDGIRILITPGMVELGDKEDEYNYLFGTYAAKACDYILLVGRGHTKPIKKGALDSGFSEKKCISYDTLEEALGYAYSVKGDGHKYILLENDLPDNY